MFVALSICSALALVIASFSGNPMVWLLTIGAIVCSAVIGFGHKNFINASLVSGPFFILSGFASLHVSLLGMSDVTLYENLPVLVCAFTLILVATLSVCISMVERASQQHETMPASEFKR